MSEAPFFGALNTCASMRSSRFLDVDDMLGCVGDVQTKLVESAVGLVCFQFVQGAETVYDHPFDMAHEACFI